MTSNLQIPWVRKAPDYSEPPNRPTTPPPPTVNIIKPKDEPQGNDPNRLQADKSKVMLPFELASPQVPSRIVESSVLTPKTAQKTVDQADRNKKATNESGPGAAPEFKANTLKENPQFVGILDPKAAAGDRQQNYQVNQGQPFGDISIRDMNMRADSVQSFGGPAQGEGQKPRNISDSFFEKRDGNDNNLNHRAPDSILRPQPVDNGKPGANNPQQEFQNGPPLRFVQTLTFDENDDKTKKKNALLDSVFDTPKATTNIAPGGPQFDRVPIMRPGETPVFNNQANKRDLRQIGDRPGYNATDPLMPNRNPQDYREVPQISLLKVNQHQNHRPDEELRQQDQKPLLSNRQGQYVSVEGMIAPYTAPANTVSEYKPVQVQNLLDPARKRLP